MLNIAVIFGGKSVEHDISVITGTLTLNSLDKSKFNAVAIYIDKQGLWFTSKANTLNAYSNFNKKNFKQITLKLGEDVLYLVKGKKLKPLLKLDSVINCTHGNNGEDGSISGLLKLCNIPFCSPNIFCSSLCIDKEYTKLMLKSLGVKTVSYKVLHRQDYSQNVDNAIKNLGQILYPVIIKPARLGSSIGIAKAKDYKELISSCNLCFKYDDKLLIEPLLQDFTEINCACYKGEKLHISQLEKPIFNSDILSFKDKYEGEGQREFPAKIEKTYIDKIKAISKKVYLSLGFNGIIRIDFIVKDKTIYLNEINTIPGSLAYYLFCNSFKEFSVMLTDLVQEGLKEHKEYNKNLFNYNTNVLKKSASIKK